jgi:ABC-type Fe3+ transport system permease subunit
VSLVAVSALVACLFATPLAYLAVRGLGEGGAVAAAWASAATLEPLARTLVLGVSVAGGVGGLGEGPG